MENAISNRNPTPDKCLPIINEFEIKPQDRGKLIGFNGVNFKKIEQTTGFNNFFKIKIKYKLKMFQRC